MTDMRKLRTIITVPDSDPRIIELWQHMASRVTDCLILGPHIVNGPPPGEMQHTLRRVGPKRGHVWGYLAGLDVEIKRFKPDLIHVNDEIWGVTTQRLILGSVPVVVHGAENIWEHGNPIERRLRRRLVQRAATRIAGYASWNRPGAEHISSLAPRGLPTAVLPAEAPSGHFRRVSWDRESVIDRAQFEVLLVGRADEEKGFREVIEAVGLLPQRAVFRVTRCGSRAADEKLAELAALRGVDYHWGGNLPYDELAAAMRLSTCLIQPSRTVEDWAEQFGRAVAEAMTMGLPVLASSSGELPRVVGVRDAIFNEGDVEEIARMLSELNHERHKLLALSEVQRKRSRMWSLESLERVLLDFWEASVDWSRARGRV